MEHNTQLPEFNYEPTYDLVIIQNIKEEETKGGIILKDNMQGLPLKGTVLAVGPCSEQKPALMKRGDVVLYNAMAISKIVIENVEYDMLKQEHIFIIYPDGKGMPSKEEAAKLIQ